MNSIHARSIMSAAMALMAITGINAQELEIATFEDLNLPADSHWVGDTEDEDYMMGEFSSGSFTFNNLYIADWDTWSFFGYASHTDTSYTSFLTDQWNCAAGCGACQSPTYGILYDAAFMGKSIMSLPSHPDGAVIPGMYVCLNSWALDAIYHGDGMNGPFAQGDYMALILTGSLGDEQTTEIEIPLADYRSATPEQWDKADTWRWVDLSPLGPVSQVQWSITSTKTSEYGITTPTYVCFDNVGAPSPDAALDSPFTPSELKVYPSVADSYTHVQTSMSGYTLSIVSVSGAVVYESRGQGGSMDISTASLPSGLYLVSLTSMNGERNTCRLLVKH